MKRYSFPLQIYLLNNRFRQQQQIIWSGQGGIVDRSIYEDAIFCKVLYEDGMMEDREYETYVNLFNNMSNFIRKPDFIVHLDVSPEQSLERIKKRSRNMESTISLDYLKKLHNGYEDFIGKISKTIPVLRIDWKKYGSPIEMAQVIKEKHESLKQIIDVNLEVEMKRISQKKKK